MRPTLEQRFWPKVDKRGQLECWPWLACTNAKGYGWFGAGDGPRLAHRVAWEIENGPIPDGLFVLHRCDNPPCVNAAHLFLGTNVDNMDDMKAKGRAPKNAGVKNGRAKLVEADVLVIRHRIAAGEMLRAIATDYGVSEGVVNHIKDGRSWAHVQLP